jgi:hypothetical protein
LLSMAFCWSEMPRSENFVERQSPKRLSAVQWSRTPFTGTPRNVRRRLAKHRGVKENGASLASTGKSQHGFVQWRALSSCRVRETPATLEWRTLRGGRKARR